MATTTSTRIRSCASRAATPATATVTVRSGNEPLGGATLDACKRAARALTAYLSVCGEKPLSDAQLQLIRALRLAEIAAEEPLYNPQKLMSMVAYFYTANQLDFAIELLAECLTGEDGEGEAILDELAVIAREQLKESGA
jgi:hypothetical protein